MIAYATPERRLIAAIIHQAVRDLDSTRHRTAAAAYFLGPNFRVDCEWLDLDPDYALTHIQERLMTQPKLTDARTRELHARHLTRKTSVARLAAEAGVSSTTLWRAFKRLGLSSARPPRSATATVRELNRLIAGLEASAGGRVRVTVDIQLLPDEETDDETDEIN